MPFLIAVALVVLTYYLLVFVAQLALVLALPMLLGGVAFVALRAYYRHGTRQAVDARLADLVGLDTSTERVVFSARPDPDVVVVPAPRQRVVLGVVPWGTAAMTLYAVYKLHLRGGFAAHLSWPVLAAAFVGAVAVMGLWAVLALLKRGDEAHNRYVAHILAIKVKKLNALAGKASAFHTQAVRNAAFRASLNAATDVPWQKLMHALQANWEGVLDNHKAFRAFVESQTQYLSSENAQLAQLCPVYAHMQAQYSQACREANWLGNEAVLHNLDTVGNGIALMVALADRSDWAQLAPVVNELAQEVQQMRNNIRLLAQAGPTADAPEEPDPITPEPGDPYAVLGVSQDLPLAQIKEVYRRLAQIYHPDKGMVNDPATFQRHQHAWNEIQKRHNAA